MKAPMEVGTSGAVPVPPLGRGTLARLLVVRVVALVAVVALLLSAATTIAVWQILMGNAQRFTPVESPESNGMAEAFVKTFKRDYVRVNPIPDAATSGRHRRGIAPHVAPGPTRSPRRPERGGSARPRDQGCAPS